MTNPLQDRLDQAVQLLRQCEWVSIVRATQQMVTKCPVCTGYNHHRQECALEAFLNLPPVTEGDENGGWGRATRLMTDTETPNHHE